MAVFAAAALADLLRYVLMLINRTTLLPPWVAVAGFLMGALAGLAAIAAGVVVHVVMTSWLISRRREAFGRYGQDDPRPESTLWLGCLVPLANLFFAPVFVLELADAEKVRERLNRPVVMWWIAWAVSWLISVIATAFSVWVMLSHSGDEPQTVADDTVTTIIAYLAGFVALLLFGQVVDAFVGKPAERPGHRWVVVDAIPESHPESEPSAEPSEETDPDESTVVVESKDREPAA